MIAISPLLEFTKEQVQTNRMVPQKAPLSMLAKAANMPAGRSREATVIGAKNLAKRLPTHRLR